MKKKRAGAALRIVVACMWAAIIIVCAFNIDKITIDRILKMTPENTLKAVAFIWLIFALKSLSVVVHYGIIGAVCGLIFPIYIALPVNIVGLVIMASIPYFIGRNLGEEGAKGLIEKYPKLRQAEMYGANKFTFVVVIRLMGLLPIDLISTLFGALGMNYKSFVISSLLGLIPETVMYTVVGRGILERNTPVIIAVIAGRIVFTSSALIISGGMKKKAAKKILDL